MNQRLRARALQEMPIFTLFRFLSRLNAFAVVTLGYITCVDLGPRLHSSTFSRLNTDPVLGIPVVVQALLMAAIMAGLQWLKLKQRGGEVIGKPVSSLSFEDLLERTSPEALGIFWGCIGFLPIYLCLDIWRI